MQILTVRDIKVSFGKRNILNGIDFEIYSEEIISISGKTGSGKTTLLGILAGLLKPDSGYIEFKGNNILRNGDLRKSRYRNRKVGFVFQAFNLLPDYSVFQNIYYPAILNRHSRDIKKNIHYLLELLDLEIIKNNYPHTLSGGERQRVAIARALINKPEIIFADEPTGNLDSITAKKIFQIFKNINKTDNIPVIFATHEKNIINDSDVHFHLNEGKLITERS